MSNNVYAIHILNNLKRHPNSTPNVKELIFFFITCSQTGGAFVSNDFLELTSIVIQRIKDKGIITDDKDPLFSLIRKCEGIAFGESKITDEEKNFISGVGELYLEIRENSFDTVNKCNRGLMELYDIRNRVLLEGKEIDELTARMFDYIDMTFIKESSNQISRRTQRFNQDNKKNYYTSVPGKKDVKKMLQDIKPYVLFLKRNKAIKRGVERLDQLDTQVYVQAFLMLEYDASFEMVASFIKSVCSEEKSKIIINELLDFSSKGPRFYEYILKKNKIEPTKIEKRKIALLKRENNLCKRQKEKKEVIRHREINEAYDLVEFENVKDESRYIDSQTAGFNLSSIYLSEKNQRSVIAIGNDRLYALSNVEDTKNALVKLCGFADINYFGHPLEKDNNQILDFYSRERGFVLMEISKIDGEVDITTHMPEVIDEEQIKTLKRIERKLINVEMLYRMRIDDNRKDESIESINKCIRTIHQKIHENKRKGIIPSWFRNVG